MPEPRFFPVDVASDLEFALIYGALLVVALLVAKQLEQVVSSLLEPAVPPAPDSKLVIGKLPLAADIDRVALVRGGVPALAELVRERAFAEGWLTSDEKGLAIGAAVPRESPLSTALRAVLPFARAQDADLERASRLVAAKHFAESAAALERHGLIRSSAARAAGTFAYAFPALGILVIGISRALRSAELGTSTTPAIAQLFVSVVAFAALAKPRQQTNAGERYVHWLQEATSALREDLTSGGLAQREDFLLLVAAHGSRALGNVDRARTSGRLSLTGEQSEGGGGTG
jgi:uncharacterized protein (TIGR04222 family)